ncbi:MAG: substrate-binding domain-containing protein [Polaromonas sp.]|nr:substrate-binding domain-containing protein [Polaromonas sp.]
MNSLQLISAGAAQALVTRFQERFMALHGYAIEPTFGAVGLMKDKLLGGAPCDVLILTDALIAQLTSSGQLAAGTAQALGVVKTGIAVKTGEARPAVATRVELTAALKAANGIYFPDAVKSTAGIHFMSVLKQLGLDQELADRLRPYPNGAAAMTAMAQSTEKGLLGCTQDTEILYIEGVDLIADLPKEFELATVYTAAVCTGAEQPAAAAALIALLASRASAALRAACGFEG